jgi:hypothetical protein
MPSTVDGTYCPGCGYDLRSLNSERCPECGLPIASTFTGIIPWERRKGIGFGSAFFRTLLTATFKPTHLARATGSPINVRSARLFRWIVRVLIIVPCVALFALALSQNGGTNALITIDGPYQGLLQPFWEPLFLWTVGATLWPILPIGFAFTVILATGISQWFFMKRLEPARRNRAMAFSYYLCSPLGWIFIPCVTCGAVMILSDSDWVGSSHAIDTMADISGLLCILSVLVLLIAIVNSIRAVDAATQCGVIRSLAIAAGVIAQAGVSIAIGLGLFPAVVGLFRLIITSLRR